MAPVPMSRPKLYRARQAQALGLGYRCPSPAPLPSWFNSLPPRKNVLAASSPGNCIPGTPPHEPRRTPHLLLTICVLDHPQAEDSCHAIDGSFLANAFYIGCPTPGCDRSLTGPELCAGINHGHGCRLGEMDRDEAVTAHPGSRRGRCWWIGDLERCSASWPTT